MRSAVVLGLIAFLALAAYGIHHNPRACRKLGLDLAADALAIYVSPADEAAKPEPEASSGTVATDATPAPSPSPASLAVAPKLPVVTPITATALAPAAPAPSPAATATPRPQFAVGYVASLPSAPTKIPLPAPLPPRRPPPATYPTATDYLTGLEAARKNHVPMLVLFTGSDWCQYCQMLEREVLSTSDFTKFSSTHFVFVTLDDLRNSPMADGDKRRITELEQRFNITGFPTMVVVDENEKEKDRIEGYDPGSGPSTVIKSLTPDTVR